MGTFTEMMTTPFEAVSRSSIAFADVNGDSAPDILITGRNSSGTPISKLYTNDGMGNFTEMTGTPFEGVEGSSIAFADVDGDADQDVLITGDDSEDIISKLYINDGMGNFTEMPGTSFEGVENGSVAFADVDGDSDQDVLITGSKNPPAPVSILYTNDGMGNFTEMTGTPFEGVSRSSIAFADVDGDADQDVLITGSGFDNGFIRVSKLYTNDGTGTFTEVIGTPFEDVGFSSIAFADVDGDSDQDILITGSNSSVDPVSKLYINDGEGNFSEFTDTPFDDVDNSSIAFADVDGDSDPDVLLAGDGAEDLIAKLYINEGVEASTSEDAKTGGNLSFIVFPNPSTSGILSISYDSKEIVEVTISVYNINGVLLSQQKEKATIGQQVFPVNVESLSKGNYLMELDNGKGRGTTKFVIQ